VLAGATVDTTDFTGSTAPAVDWTGAIGSLAGALSHLTSSVGANFTACDLTGANLSGRDLHTFTLDTTRLSGVNLSGATLPSSLLLGYLASDGSEVRFSYDTNKSATTNKADFLAALATVDSTQPAVVIEAAAIWVDGSALSP
jgi:uncharacterized protein YjbI with pentapeptide repeats